MVWSFLSNLGRIFGRSYKKFNKDRCPLLAQALTHSAVFSLFPFLFGVISISLYVLGTSESINDKLIPILQQVFPHNIDSIIASIKAVKQTSVVVAVLSVLFFIWSVAGILRSIETSLNVIWHGKEDRPFFRKVFATSLLALAITILFSASLAVTFMSRTAGTRIFAFLMHYSTPITLLVSINTFAFIYRYFPNHKVGFKEAYFGAAFTGIAWEIAKHLFALYVTKVVNYTHVYGSLSTIILIYMWVYYSAYIFLYGAELSYLFANRNEIANNNKVGQNS